MNATTSVPVLRIDGSAHAHEHDALAVEEPLEIRVAYRSGGEPREKPVSVTMRTPGDDFELAAGFLFTEGIVEAAHDVESVRHWGSANVVRVELKTGVRVDLKRLERHFYTTSSCGVCGKTSIDALRVHTRPIESDVTISAEVVHRLPALLREAQTTFDATGGIHGAGLFTANGKLLRVREDVGRHNAVDKAIGSLLLEPIATTPDMIVVSGRAGFELVQKSVVARIPMLAAVGAPSSLAVELAREYGMTLLGFVRDNRFNVYAGEERVRH